MAYKVIFRTLITIASVTFASQLIYNFYQRRKKQVNPHRKEINEVIIFSYGTLELKKSKYSRCVVTPSMERFLYYLNGPRYNIDICMYIITNSDVSNVLMKLHYRGIKIRLIIDADMAYCTGSCARKLEKHGVPVRWLKSTNLMHHKFCLIDTLADDGLATPYVMLGSLNWTNQAMSGNWEDVTVTSQKDLVQQYQAAFEKLWMLFKPIDFT
ncbi:PREDICTED: mitochondrial cardiolipin hydrolase-like [Papilio polytes]|uniref:mitochondrial cardiolipin hydrolase-like n=1 Tax=Papilio polytes TaxID=76194 RepID=UPI00067664E7|nr:PREDICTED: mitochondrial cardiolipin hydrolase-like [Papilio polytes]